MLVRLIHEKHGEHIAYSQVEVDKCLENGWRYKPEPKAVEVVEAPKKRGRPKKVEK